MYNFVRLVDRRRGLWRHEFSVPKKGTTRQGGYRESGIDIKRTHLTHPWYQMMSETETNMETCSLPDERIDDRKVFDQILNAMFVGDSLSHDNENVFLALSLKKTTVSSTSFAIQMAQSLSLMCCYLWLNFKQCFRRTRTILLSAFRGRGHFNHCCPDSVSGQGQILVVVNNNRTHCLVWREC